MKRELALMVGAGILKQQYPYEQVVDPTFAKNAMQTIKQSVVAIGSGEKAYRTRT